jgi:hypothetical protein
VEEVMEEEATGVEVVVVVEAVEDSEAAEEDAIMEVAVARAVSSWEKATAIGVQMKVNHCSIEFKRYVMQTQ